MTRHAPLPVVVVALLAAALDPGTAPAQQLTYAGSVQYTSGTYIFTEPTRTVSLYNGLSWDAGRFRLSASLPVILQNSGAVTLVGDGYLPTGGEQSGAVGGRQQGQKVPMGTGGGGPHRSFLSADGAVVPPARQMADSTRADSMVQAPGDYRLTVGDPLMSAGVELYRGFGVVRSVELTGSVKAPMNDLESGVGTGEWDYAVGGAAAAALGPVLGFIDVAWWWYGDLPDLELRDGAAWGMGVGLPLSRAVWLSAMATRTNRILESAEAASSGSLGLSYHMGGAGTLSVTAGAGLTETAPDFTLSVGWRRSVLGP